MAFGRIVVPWAAVAAPGGLPAWTLAA
jgi:hypothetical protein